LILLAYLLIGSYICIVSTKEKILQITDELVRDKGFNAFSFYDISKAIGIKTASIHYHFPNKSDLGIALIHQHIDRLKALQEKVAEKSVEKKLDAFLSIYSNINKEKKVCIVGSLATDLHSIDESVGNELRILTQEILDWVTKILEEGKKKKIFYFSMPARSKALMIITNMLAALQITRLTNNKDFNIIKQNVINDLKKQI